MLNTRTEGLTESSVIVIVSDSHWYCFMLNSTPWCRCLQVSSRGASQGAPFLHFFIKSSTITFRFFGTFFCETNLQCKMLGIKLVLLHPFDLFNLKQFD